MENTHEPGDNLATRKLALTAKNLQRILNIERDQDTLQALIHSLEQSLSDADARNPVELCEAMVLQTRILDAAFTRFAGEAEGPHADRKILFAMKAQRQMVSTALAWKELNTATYMKYKLVKFLPKNFGVERTEQNAPLDG